MPYPPPSLHCFTYTPEGDKLYELDLTMGPTYSSRETSGVWVFGDWAWKIFPTMNQWSRVLEDCQAATSHGLPTPSFQQYSGTITYSNGRTKEGFALVTTHITDPARFFALKCGTGTLMQLIAPIANDDMLSKIEQALGAAINMGLQDPQGFVNQYNPQQPIMFIDLHTHSSAAQALHTVYRYVGTRRAALQQQWG